MDICIDFDGTCVTHEYPEVGEEIGSIPVLKALIENGHRLILFTMRSERELADAINWFNRNEIALYGIQSNPTQQCWTRSPKAYGQLYIDDAALGIPLCSKKILNLSPLMKVLHKDGYAPKRKYVDWKEVEKILIDTGVIKI